VPLAPRSRFFGDEPPFHKICLGSIMVVRRRLGHPFASSASLPDEFLQRASPADNGRRCSFLNLKEPCGRVVVFRWRSRPGGGGSLLRISGDQAWGPDQQMARDVSSPRFLQVAPSSARC